MYLKLLSNWIISIHFFKSFTQKLKKINLEWIFICLLDIALNNLAIRKESKIKSNESQTRLDVAVEYPNIVLNKERSSYLRNLNYFKI